MRVRTAGCRVCGVMIQELSGNFCPNCGYPGQFTVMTPRGPSPNIPELNRAIIQRSAARFIILIGRAGLTAGVLAAHLNPPERVGAAIAVAALLLAALWAEERTFRGATETIRALDEEARKLARGERNR